MREVKNVLDDIFKRPEKEVKYFVGVMSAPIDPVIPGAKKTHLEKLKDGTPEKMRAAVFAMQTSGHILIQHGWDGDDYVWHIEPINKRKWRSSVDRAIYATAKVMSQTIPDDVRVNIHKPYEDWDIKVITFKAFGLKSRWNITKSDIDKMNLALFTVLNTLI